MRIVQQLLSLVVASGFVLNATASHKSREFGVCEDRPGVVSYAEPCKYTFLWFKWGCTAYTCENIGCDSDFAQRVCPNKCSECTTVVDIAIDGGFLLLVEFVAKANLVEILQSAGPFTVFAPDDAAFKALPAATLAKYRDDPDDIWSSHLIDLLLYHVVAGDIRSTDLTNGAVVETLSGESVTVDLINGVFINDAAVIAVDNVAANGVVHVIDEVLLPTSATTTIFEIGEEVSTGDVPAFTTLMLLVDLADAAVKDALESNGPITLFAPTDAAFAKLDQATLVFLTSETKEAKAALTEILTYHVVSGNVASTSLTQGLTATTVQGENIIVSSLNPPTINGNSLIIDTDILASNGIIHVINTVLLPKDLE
mmetsp:Transcript_926/g.1726  ORF Transcript_926/g.1726 Transcript_926/m.1726 type:complete len:369 (-) Transcript_926:106-1212(-)|eukprot:CAMPEP_0198302598 /NCGR_PEP_ID=MMETSP1449-20131203/55789_1 /TAXON_ID=420275 /ORGANISM="Attheya septentrionalis, Strain CCMP2084" /LENGTH=368 /DNA_ID=CAMNT_0044004995 /DNA_START=32 /DNA_END=1138 /DNA_ORIENTATION=+